MSANNPELAGLPEHFVKAVQGFFAAVEPFYGKNALTVGGDAVLAARFGHRQIGRIEVYGHPGVLAETYKLQDYGRRIGEALEPIASAPTMNTELHHRHAHVTESVGQFDVLVDGLVLIQVLADRTHIGEMPFSTEERFPGTSIGVWNTADILSDTMRRTKERIDACLSPLDEDIEDLATAHQRDRASLRQAFQCLKSDQQILLCDALRRCELKTVTPAGVADLLEGPVNRRAGLEFSLGS